MVFTISNSCMVLVALIGLAMIFKKMGIEWWKAFIPVYGEYVLFKKVWNTDMFVLALGSFLAWKSTEDLIANCSLEHTTLGLVLMMVELAACIALLVTSVMVLHKVSVSFGHGKGYTTGLVFATPVFLNILGFDNSKYQEA